MTDPNKNRHPYWLVRVASISAVLSLVLVSVSPAASFRWSAGELSQAADGPRRVLIQGRTAVLFDSKQKTQIDLTSRYPWRELNGCCTVRLIFQTTQQPAEKTPLISKWHMTNGGRAFELGVTADGRPYFDVSGSGNWDRAGRELLGACRIIPGQPYCITAVFEPGSRMLLFLNGHDCGQLTWQVPQGLHANDAPVLLGAQPPGKRWADVAISELLVDRRALTHDEIREWAQSVQLTELPGLIPSPVLGDRMDLSVARAQILDHCASLQVEGGPYGAVRTHVRPDAPVTLYATCDVAWIRGCMGEILTSTLTATQRREWIDHINSFARPDGTYENPNHGEMHRNGMVIGTLAVLGGRQKYAVSLYDEFDELDEIESWLERIQWDRQWGASHLFWGGMHCYSLSSRCSNEWRERVFLWLDQNLDPISGWWRRGVPQSGRHIEVLGGAAHIWPIYQHHQRRFPYPQQIIDSILELQRPDGSWLNFGNYMELDALYGLAYAQSLAATHRADDVATAARRHGRLVQSNYQAFLASDPHTHSLLAVVGTLALLQELDSERFGGDVRWSDIFSDRKFYETANVEHSQRTD
jgi:hypothetical protein